jgi:hypothetical protein
VASRHPAVHDREEDARDVDLTQRIRSRTREGTDLLPGALVLLGYHVLAVRSGGPSHLLPLVQIVFVASLLSVTVSVLLLALLGVRASLAHQGQRARQLLQASVLAAAGRGALSAALAGDLFVVAARLTGSVDVGALAGAVLLVLIYMPWL